ncbi:type II toxin-antitoxin system prevent-host-death family antitoxin [Bacillaceae bacterium W0354]
MKVTSTELQNNFGKYLMLAAHEDIIVTRNGTEIARLSARDKNQQDEGNASRVNESTPLYGFGKKATYDDFLRMRRESDERYEYINGEIYFLASPKTAHQYAVSQLFGMFYNTFQRTQCIPFSAPYDIELKKSAKEINIVQPDIMVICDLDEHLGDDDYYNGVPSLIVEVLSESTRNKDLILKLNLYRSCGVNEYWIVNPERQQIMIYLFDDGSIKDVVTYNNNDVAQSFIFENLKVGVSKVFRGKTPE